MRALVVEHLAEEGTGAFAEWLPAAGLDLAVHQVERDGPPPAIVDGYDALLVMGGSMGVPDAGTTHPGLHDDMALLRDAVARNIPVLGVCLGAQLLAAACGGAVIRGRVGPELGVRRVHLAPAAAADPLLGGLPPVVEAVQWHWDEVLALPPGATLLAGSPAYPHQAFRVGERAWGVQFHPEARPSMVERWARNDAAEVRAAGEDAAAHVADVAAAWPELRRTWRIVADRFAKVVHDAAGMASNAVAGPLS
ncbi:MAG TPA: type 1 glutamine amidotransferase [Mycobacteriales bacterium]|nr:type 1 glutamine amidotransferase [Mycobacteriales bacterium]